MADTEVSQPNSPEIRKALKRHASALDENSLTSKRRRSSLASTLEVVHHDLFASSSSTSHRCRAKGRDTSDRYIASAADNTIPILATPRSHSLARALGMASSRRLVFREQRTNVMPSDDQASLHSLQKNLNKTLYELPMPPSATSASTNLQTSPEMSLSAPGMLDDFYSRPAAWGKTDLLAVATKYSVNFRNMVTAEVGCVTRLISLDKPTCLEWSPSADILALGLDWGDTRLFDVRKQTLVLDIPGMSYVGGMSWNGEHLLTIATECGSIRHYDTRLSGRNKCALHSVGHNSRVCGVKWSADQRYLISGSGDGAIMLWDARASKGLELFNEFGKAVTRLSLGDDSTSTPSPPSASVLNRVWRQKQHTSTVKALAWCPWQPDLFASGGGTRDGTIRIWSSSTGECKKIFKTRSQVSSLHFSHSCREIVSTHGYAFAYADARVPSPRSHSVLVHSLATGEQTGKVFDVGHGRISDSAMSPDGTRIVTCGADETIRLYRVFGEQMKLEEDKETLWQQNLIR